MSDEGLTREEFIDWLNSKSKGDNEEAVHYDADLKMIEYLKSIGEDEVARAFKECRRRVGFWYA